MILKLYSLFAGKFANFNVLETSIYMFRYGLSNICSLKFRGSWESQIEIFRSNSDTDTDDK